MSIEQTPSTSSIRDRVPSEFNEDMNEFTGWNEAKIWDIEGEIEGEEVEEVEME